MAISQIQDSDRDAHFAAHLSKDVLRFIACGSVDDGKSTLIGRLLHDTQHILDDQLAALKRASRRHGTVAEGLDFALLVDGLAAEREQGITIDVAYRFFSTARRSFIVADTPGHEQYTRNMATGASTADVAVLLVDARSGLTRQTRRHALLASMLGIRRVVLAINKMDLTGWSRDAYETAMADFEAYAAPLQFVEIVGIPLSALSGDNVAMPGVSAPWYTGPTLLDYLENVPIADDNAASRPFRFPVQWVSRRSADFRGFAGMIAGGAVNVGDRIQVWPSGRQTTVARIVTYDGDLERAVAGQSVTLILADDLDASRGDVLAAVGQAPPLRADRLAARLFWIGEKPLQTGDAFVVKLGTAAAVATIEAVQARVDPDNGRLDEDAVHLTENDIGDVTLTLDRTLVFDPYAANRETGGFLLIDRESADTAGLGLVLVRPNLSAPLAWEI